MTLRINAVRSFFKTPPSAPDASGRWGTVEWLCMLVLAAVTLASYLATLAPGVDPTGSASCLAMVFNLSDQVPSKPPLWLLLCRLAAALPSGNAVLLLNTLSAACGSFAVVLLFRVTRRTVFELIRPPPSIRLEPMEDAPAYTHCGSTAAPANSDIPDDFAEHLIATLGGVIAALAFAFCAPFWAASTSLNTEPFHTLALLLLLDRAFCYCFTARAGALALALFLLGLGAVESVLFLAVAPIILLALLCAAAKHEQLCESFFLVCILVISAGLALNLSLLAYQTHGIHPPSWAQLKELLSGLCAAHQRHLTEGLPSKGWLYIVFQSTFPITLSVVCLRRMSPLNDAVTKWKWGLIALGSAAFATACLLALPFTATGQPLSANHLPVVPSLSVAFAVGAFFAYWANSYAQQDTRCLGDDEQGSVGLRLISISVCTLIAIITLRVINANINISDGRQTAFADRVANEVLSLSGPAICLVTEGLFDINLLLAAQKSEKKVSVASCPGLRSPTVVSRPQADTDQAAQPPPQPERVIARWLHDNSAFCSQVAVFGNRYVWQLAGLSAVPQGLVYSGAAAAHPIDHEKAYELNAACWSRIDEILAARPIRRPALTRLAGQVTALASRTANDLGALLEQEGDWQKAAVCYQRALAYNADNICARLNLLALSLKGPQNGPTPITASLLPAASEAPLSPETAIYFCGALAHQSADRILPLLLQRTDPKRDAKQLAALLRRWLYAFSELMVRGEPPFTTPNAYCGLSKASSQLGYAASLIAQGKKAQAEKQLQLLVKREPDHFAAWSLLADLLLEKGQLAAVKETVLPALAKPKSEGDQILAFMTQAACAQQESPPRLETARQCYRKVLAIAPRFQPASASLAITSGKIGDWERLESDVQLILAGDRADPVANALLGKIRLRQRNYPEAEKQLRLSLASKPLKDAMALFAHLLRQTGQPEQAEKWARRAVCAQPDDPESWDLLANVLLDAERVAEARSALLCAAFWDADHPVLKLTSQRLLARSSQRPAEPAAGEREAQRRPDNAPQPACPLGAVGDRLLTSLSAGPGNAAVSRSH